MSSIDDETRKLTRESAERTMDAMLFEVESHIRKIRISKNQEYNEMLRLFYNSMYSAGLDVATAYGLDLERAKTWYSDYRTQGIED